MFKCKALVSSAMLIALVALSACSAKIDASSEEKAQKSLEKVLKGNDFEDLAKFQVGWRILKGQVDGMTFDEVKDAGKDQFKPGLFGLGKGYDDEVDSLENTLKMTYKTEKDAAKGLAGILSGAVR